MTMSIPSAPPRLGTRALMVVAFLSVVVLALVGRSTSAAAQPTRAQPSVRVIDPATQQAQPAPRLRVIGVESDRADRDQTEGSGTGMAILFWAFALGTIGGSIFVITRRNLIAAVMGMVATFFAVAGVYMMLYAHFLAVIQMLVYAGAIMVLFVFVVMILNKPEDEPWALTGIPGKALAALAMLYLTVRLGQTLWAVKPGEGEAAIKAAMAAPPPVMIPTGKTAAAYDWGSTGAVGSNLFDEFLFPFEAVSILLLVAVVGAIAIARPLKDEDEAEAEHPEAGSDA